MIIYAKPSKGSVFHIFKDDDPKTLCNSYGASMLNDPDIKLIYTIVNVSRLCKTCEKIMIKKAEKKDYITIYNYNDGDRTVVCHARKDKQDGRYYKIEEC